MQMCETTNRNRIVKAQGVEASWHMAAKPTGSTPTVNAAFVHRKFAFLPGEICTAGGAKGRRHDPDWFHRDTKTQRRSELPAACRRNWQQRRPRVQRDPQQCGP